MWREITEDDTRSALSAPELSAYRAAATASGQDVLAQITAQVVQECRAHIADCPHNKLAPGNTLPERAHYHALALIRFRMLTRVPGQEIDEARKIEQRDAVAFFRRAAECKVDIEQPEGAVENTGGAPMIGTIQTRPTIASREQLSGL